jgi:hypothetical protein
VVVDVSLVHVLFLEVLVWIMTVPELCVIVLVLMVRVQVLESSLDSTEVVRHVVVAVRVLDRLVTVLGKVLSRFSHNSSFPSNNGLPKAKGSDQDLAGQPARVLMHRDRNYSGVDAWERASAMR